MMAPTETKQVGENFVILRSDEDAERRIGIYARGGCHLAAMFGCAPLIQQELKGTCCIHHDGDGPRCRSDLELQSLRELPEEWVAPVVEKLRLGDDYFRPRLFNEDFVVPASTGPERFPKTVVVLHIGMDATRTMYRHRQHGFLVDPGGAWLQSLDAVLGNLPVVAWFRKNFESIGMISVDAFMENYTRIINLLRVRAGAKILVLNTLTIEPGNLTHNYQIVKHPHARRLREFNIALWELSRQLDFAVVDVDRILKCAGTRSQTEFAHFLPQHNLFIAHEAYRIMRDLDIF
jgi:hypothetical protein